MRSFSLGFFNSLGKVLHPSARRPRRSLFLTDGTSPVCAFPARIRVNAKGVSATNTMPGSREDARGGSVEMPRLTATAPTWGPGNSIRLHKGETREFVRSPEPGA